MMQEKQYTPIGKIVLPLIQKLREGTAHYNFILIKAGTGKGKTRFALEELLEYAMAREEKILYLVNRTALKKQIEKRVNDKAQRNPYQYGQIRQSITIETYAALEKNCAHVIDNVGVVVTDAIVSFANFPMRILLWTRTIIFTMMRCSTQIHGCPLNG